MREITVACALVFAMAFAVTAEDYSGSVRLNDEDTAANQSWNNAGNWADGKKPSSTKNYYVPADTLLWHQSSKTSDASTKTWSGGQLVIGGTFLSEVNNEAKYGPYVQDLVLLGGSECRLQAYAFLGTNGVGALSGVTVQGTLENPAVISHHHTDSSNEGRQYRLNASFSGSSDSALVLTLPYVNHKGETIVSAWPCDIPATSFASYAGTVIMRGGNFKAQPYPSTDSYNMPQATLRVEDGANCRFFRKAITTVPDAQIGALDSVGGKLYFNCRTSGGAMSVNPVVNISERLSLDADTVITLPTNTTPFLVGVTPENPSGITTHKIAHLTGSAAETVGDLSAAKVEVAGNAQLGYPVKLQAIANGDGTKDVYLGTPNVVVMTNENFSGSVGVGAFDAGNGWMWTNLETPAADSACTYLTQKTLTFTADANYPSATLSAAAPTYSIDGANYRFKTINLCEGGSFRSWGTAVKYRTYTAEKLNVLSSSGRMDVSAGVGLTIDADVCGDGNLEIGNYNNGAGSLHLTHLNTNFHGRLTIRQMQGKSDTFTPRNFATNLSDARNWGGEFADAENAYQAITLKNFPSVSVQTDVAFPASGRGIFVQGGVGFTILSGRTLTLSNQVTYAGVVEKYGAGTFELAGVARFLDGRADTAPIAGTNALHIIAGALKISSKAAADGLAISFAEGTKLVIPADTEAGYFNRKWSVPLTIETANGKLPVEIDPEGVESGANVAVPVCTFSTAAADNILATAFSVTMDKPNMRLKSFGKRSNGDDTVSYVAVFGPVGCRLILR